MYTEGIWMADPELLVAALKADESRLSDDPADGVNASDTANVRTIRINGSLNKQAGPIARLLGSQADPKAIRMQAKQARKDDDVDAVFLQFNSPGGRVSGVPLAAKEIRKLSDEKPTIAYADGSMASAAYWLASGADRRYAAPTARVGSLAAMRTVKSYAEKLEDEGIDVRVIRSGEWKGKPHPAEQLTSESVSVIEGKVESMHESLVDDLAAGLGLPREEAAELADGRYYLPEKAKEKGLIDGVLSPEEARERTGSTSEPTTISAEMRDPKYSKGDKVKWSWQGSDVHGRVADVGEEFTVSGNTITGEEDEPVYKIDEYDDDSGEFKSGNVAKPESSLSKSDKNMSDQSDTEARLANLEETVGALTESVEAVLDQAATSAEEDDETEEDVLRAKAEALVAEYDDRVAPAEEDKFVEIGMTAGLDHLEDVLARLEPNAPEDSAPDAEADNDPIYGEMEKFADDIGTDDEGRVLATNEEDARVFADLGLDYKDVSA